MQQRPREVGALGDVLERRHREAEVQETPTSAGQDSRVSDEASSFVIVAGTKSFRHLVR